LFYIAGVKFLLMISGGRLHKYLIAFVLLFSLSSFVLHKFYVSVTEIEYDEDAKDFKIILYTFPDDLQLALKSNYGKSVDYTQNDKKINQLIEKYLKANLRLFTEENEIHYNFLGYTFENEQILLLIETDTVSLPVKLKVRQTWLTDIYPTQKNIIHLNVGNEKQSDILDRKRKETEFVITK